VPGPEALPDWSRPSAEVAERLPEKMRRFLVRERPFELRPVDPVDYLDPQPAPPLQHIWLRTAGALPDDPRLHRCLLAYISDFNLLGTATRPHATDFSSENLTMASIDHAMWFHRDFRIDDWLLYSMDSPSASGARGFARGSLYDRGGRLVASTAQEGLVRVRR
jgi:acyl-CoA thioesterase-2